MTRLLPVVLCGCVVSFPPTKTLDDDTDSAPPVDTEPASFDTGTPPDRDGDGLPDQDDPCPDEPGDSADLDGDSVGDACDDDRDGDGVPDTLDRWPDDGTFPALASGESIYPHTARTLYVLRIRSSGETLDLVADFTFDVRPPPGRARHEMTDLAVDRSGLLYGITYEEIFVCHPVTAACRKIGDLPVDSNGLTFVPEAGGDTLVALGGANWVALDLASSVVTSRTRGVFEPGCSGTCAKASGDAFSIEGVGTFATVFGYGGFSLFDQLVELDPATGNVKREVLRFVAAKNDTPGIKESFRDLWGLAGWTDGFFYGFAKTGEVLKIDVTTGRFSVLFDANVAWWGAGVRTIVPPQP